MEVHLITLVYLTAMSVLDIMKKRISLLAAALYLFLILLLAAGGSIEIEGKAWSLLLGALVAACSFLTHGAVGAGDAVIVLTLGAAYPPGKLLMLLSAALLFCGAFSGLALVLKKKTAKDELPFIPFLLAGEAYVLLYYMLLSV